MHVLYQIILNFLKYEIAGKVQGWCEDIKMLADIAESEPQAAYSAYISGIQHR